MTGADKISIPGQSQDLGEKNGNVKVSDLIEEGTAVRWTGTKGAVTGTVRKDPESVKPLYGESEQEGHFFPIEFKAKYYDKNIELGGRAGGSRTVTLTAEDPYLIVRLENLSGNKLTAAVKSTQEEIFELDFSGAEKAEE